MSEVLNECYGTEIEVWQACVPAWRLKGENRFFVLSSFLRPPAFLAHVNILYVTGVCM